MSRWTPEEVDYLRSQWRTRTKAKHIAEQMGRPLRAVYQKAFKLGLPKKADPNKVDLDREQTEWLRRNFPHIRTEICALRLGISHRTTIRIARRLGLNKTDEFIRECQTYSSRKAHESHCRYGTYPPKGVVTPNLEKGRKHRFKPGHSGHKNTETCDTTTTKKTAYGKRCSI